LRGLIDATGIVFGDLPFDAAKRSLTLFMRQVAPAFPTS